MRLSDFYGKFRLFLKKDVINHVFIPNAKYLNQKSEFTVPDQKPVIW